MIHIIDKLKMTKKGLVAKDTKQEVHLQQGAMDGACAVYSMMMTLIIIGSIDRNDVVSLNDETIKGNTSKGRLINHFLYKNGFVRKGYYLSELEEDLRHTYKKMVNTKYLTINDNDNDNLLDAILDALDHGNPVELGFCRKENSAHAVVAIGYEEIEKGYLLYILDPGYAMPYGQYWNNVIVINTQSTREYNAFNAIEKSQILINEALIIIPK